MIPRAMAAAVAKKQTDVIAWCGHQFSETSNLSPIPHIHALTRGQATFGRGGKRGKRLRIATPKESTRFGYACVYAPDGRLWVLTSRASDSAPWPQYLCHFSEATLDAAEDGDSVTPDIQITLPSAFTAYLSFAFDLDGNAWLAPTPNFTLSRINAENLVAGTLSAFDIDIAIKDGVGHNPTDLVFAGNGDVFVPGLFNGSGCGIAWLQAAQIASSTPDVTTSPLIPYKQIGMRGTANKRGYSGIALDPTGGGVWVTGIQVAGGNGPAIYRYGFDKFDGNGTDSPPAGCHDPTPDASLTCATSGVFDSPMCPRFDSNARLHWTNRWVSGAGVVGAKLYAGGRLAESVLGTDGALAVTPDRLFGSPATPGGLFAFVPPPGPFNPLLDATCEVWIDVSDGDTITLAGDDFVSITNKATGHEWGDVYAIGASSVPNYIDGDGINGHPALEGVFSPGPSIVASDEDSLTLAPESPFFMALVVSGLAVETAQIVGTEAFTASGFVAIGTDEDAGAITLSTDNAGGGGLAIAHVSPTIGSGEHVVAIRVTETKIYAYIDGVIVDAAGITRSEVADIDASFWTLFSRVTAGPALIRGFGGRIGEFIFCKREYTNNEAIAASESLVAKWLA